MKCDLTTKWYQTFPKRLHQLLPALLLLIRGLWIRTRGSDRATDEAMQWVIRLHSGEDLGPLLPEFRRWLDARPGNRDRFGELWELWKELSALQDSGASRRLCVPEKPTREEARREPFPARRTAGVAFIAVLALGIGLYLSHHSALPCTPSAASNATQCLIGGHHASRGGETVTLGLIDGSTVTLTGTSKVTLDLYESRRHVWLDQGEARFQVAKNLHAFEVSAVDGVRIRAVGTDFSVRKTHPQGARVEVSEGAVDLLIGDRPAVEIHAGETAEFDSNVIRTTKENGVWFIFHDEPLTDAVREFNRYNTKPKIIVDGDVTGRGVHGWFLARNPRDFAAMMASTLEMTSSISRDSTGMETIHLSKGDPHWSAPHKTRGRFSVEGQQ